MVRHPLKLGVGLLLIIFAATIAAVGCVMGWDRGGEFQTTFVLSGILFGGVGAFVFASAFSSPPE